MVWLNAAAALGTFASAILAAVAVWIGLATFKRQSNAQVFLEYTARYRDVMASFPPEARRARLFLDSVLPVESEELSLAVLRYLNLCSEEFYLCRSGYLAKDVWHIWEGEIRRSLGSPLLVREWASLQHEFVAYPEFITYVQSIQSARGAVASIAAERRHVDPIVVVP